MTPQQIVGIALRLLALWLALNSVRYLIWFPIALIESDLANRTAYSYSIGIVYIVGALLLWFFPMWLANKLTPRSQFENRLNLQPLEAIRAGCALIGLWLFASGLPNLVWFFFRAIVFNSDTSAFSSLDLDTKLDIAVALFEVCFSLVLIFRAGQFASMVDGVVSKPASNDGTS
jgi:hypothetical protein